LTAGQIKAAAFVDELRKEADSFLSRMGKWTTQNPITSIALTNAGFGAHDLYKHGPWGEGGRSIPETELHKQVQALGAQDQSDPIVQEALKDTLTKQRAEVRKGESAGVTLATAAPIGAAILANKKLLGPSIMRGEAGASTSSDQIRQMAQNLGVKTPIMESMGGLRAARTIPKGGLLPRFLNKLEASMHRDVFKEPADAQRAIKQGLTIVPLNTGPHISAHELGHVAFGNSSLGKATRALRLPAAIGGALTGSMMAGSSDPESTSSKLAPAVSLAGMMPILGEEAMASLKGIKSMREIGLSPTQISVARKQLGKALGTYGLGLGSIASAPYVLRKLRQFNQSRREEQGLPSVGQLQQRIQSLPQATGE
jgi:hypothetical protein